MHRRKWQFGLRPMVGEELRDCLTAKPSHGYAVSFRQSLELLELVRVDVHGEPFFGCHCILPQSAAVQTLRPASDDVNAGGPPTTWRPVMQRGSRESRPRLEGRFRSRTRAVGGIRRNPANGSRALTEEQAR